VAMDGSVVLTSAVSLPPAALIGFTAATSTDWERVTVSGFTATLALP